MVTVDSEGCDLACGETVQRIAWSAPAANAADVRAELVRLARAARQAAAERAGRAEAGAATVLPEDPEVFGH
jgi:putative heme iron utilization protein